MVVGVSGGFFPSWRVETGFLVIVGVVFLSQTGFCEGPDISEYLKDGDTAHRLEKGDLVVFKGTKFNEIFGSDVLGDGRGTLVMFLVSKPPTTAWNLLNDFDNHHTFMPRVTESEVKWNNKDVYCIRYRYEVLWSDSTNYLFAQSDADTMTLLWRLDTKRCDKRLEGMTAFWKIERYDDRRTLVAIFRNLKHSSAFNALTQKLLVTPRSGARAIRRHVESYKKPAD